MLTLGMPPLRGSPMGLHLIRDDASRVSRDRCVRRVEREGGMAL